MSPAPRRVIDFTRRDAIGRFAATALTAAIGQHAAWGQTAYPNKPIRLIIGYPPGGGVDVIARLLAPRLSAVLGQAIVVDNRVGAAGAIAADAGAKAAPDGYTLFLGDSSILAGKVLQPRLPFDPVRSFTPIASVFRLPLILVANNEFPARNPREMIAALKARPGYYSYGTPGVGTIQHLAVELLKGKTGTFIVHIPYRGASQILPDLIGGQLPLAALTATAAMAQARAGRVRALARLSPEKLPGAENVPPLADVVSGFDAAPRIFLLAPAQTPRSIVQRLTEATQAVMGGVDLEAAAAQQGAVPAYLGPEALADAMSEESRRWGAVIREQKISSE